MDRWLLVKDRYMQDTSRVRPWNTTKDTGEREGTVGGCVGRDLRRTGRIRMETGDYG